MSRPKEYAQIAVRKTVMEPITTNEALDIMNNLIVVLGWTLTTEIVSEADRVIKDKNNEKGVEQAIETLHNYFLNPEEEDPRVLTAIAQKGNLKRSYY